ncbi:MAG: alpha/beta fold hydrolase [Nevskia sp.]
MPYAFVNNQNIFYEDTGGDGPVLMFSHGLLMDHTMFAPQIAAFRERYRCIAWDERGHGRTAGGEPLPPFSYYDSANDLAALLRHLEVSRAVLVGMSQGGYLSLRAALKHPTLVRALVLIDTQAMPEDPAKMPAYAQMLGDWAENGLGDETATIIEQIILGQDWPGAAEWKAKWRRVAPHNLLQCFHTLGARDDISEAIRGIRVPTLVLHGDQDLAITLDRAQAMDHALPNSRFVVVEGAGHAANLTHPAQVNPLIEDFLATLS